jgi:PBP1b-binding outer membrane lipoprotein LpoB
MIKLLRTCIILLLAVFILLSGCARDTKHFEEQEKKPAVEDKAQSKVEEETESGNKNFSKDIEEHQNTSPVETIPQNEDTPGNQEELPIDLEKVKPNEAGKIMVVMFHNFIETYRSGIKNIPQHSAILKSFYILYMTAGTD